MTDFQVAIGKILLDTRLQPNLTSTMKALANHMDISEMPISMPELSKRIPFLNQPAKAGGKH